MEKQVVSTSKAPAAIGPYSQAISIGNFIFTSGQIPINPSTGEMPESIEEQAHQSMQNIRSILEHAGTSLDNVVKVTIFLKDFNYFGKVNEIYSSYFTGDYPARSCVEIARLPKDALIEIEAVAIIS